MSHNVLTDLAHKRIQEILPLAEHNYFKHGGFINNVIDRNLFADYMIKEACSIGAYMVKTGRWKSNYCLSYRTYLIRSALARARAYKLEAPK